MARSSREPQSRFPPLHITTHGAGLLSSQFLRSAKLGTGEGRARLSRVRAANGGGTKEVPAWASLEVPRTPACSSPQEVRENGPRTRVLAWSPSASS